MSADNEATTGRAEPLDEVIALYRKECDEGQAPDRQGCLHRHPDLAEDLTRFFADEDCLAGQLPPVSAERPMPGQAPVVTLPCRFGDYELLEKLGSGGMGIVYKARQLSLNRLVALKMVQIDRSGLAREGPQRALQPTTTCESDNITILERCLP